MPTSTVIYFRFANSVLPDHLTHLADVIDDDINIMVTIWSSFHC